VIVQLAGKMPPRMVQISSLGATGHLTVVLGTRVATRTYTAKDLRDACKWVVPKVETRVSGISRFKVDVV